MSDPKPLGEAIAERFQAEHAEAVERPFVVDPELEALSTRLAEMREAAPSMYAAQQQDRERLERYSMRKADHAAGRAPSGVVNRFGGRR